MCGLIAAWDPAGLADAPLAAALADLRHRGPDAQAILWREDHRLHLAHARLKIIDTTDGANQPYVSSCGRWAIAYNGEIYNFRELRQEIADRWPWRTHGDTEVLMAAWSVWGEGCLGRLVGMFAFVIHDRKEHVLTAVRDRFGIKPLYHISAGARRVFASEIPPLLRFQPVLADLSTIRTYLELGLYDHTPHTFFQNVRSLEPGTLLQITLSTGSEVVRRWYNLPEMVPDLGGASEKELVDQAEQLVLQAVSSHLVADVRVGLNVSGGVDSAMLVCAAIRNLGQAHLFVQDYTDYSELPWVREIAKGGILHVSSLDSAGICSSVKFTTRSQAEPFGGVTVCGYNFLYQSARHHGITVLLDGNGVDEAFLGYESYHQIYVATAPDENTRRERARDYSSYWGHSPRPVGKNTAIDGTAAVRPEAVSAELRKTPLLLPNKKKNFTEPVRQKAFEDLTQAKLPRALRFNDRVSMAYSRELRVPFLDHRLVEFAFGLPVEMLLNRNGTKGLFRQVLARHAPESVAFAPKRSVQSPQREWLAGPWKQLVTDSLFSGSFADRGWVAADKMSVLYEDYCAGKRENSFFLWQWLNLEWWAREFLDGRS